MSNFNSKNVLITGGASGIGKLMGRMVLENGAANLVIWDINDAALEETKLEFATLKGNVHTYKVNVANVEEIKNSADLTLKKLGSIDILINNAGIVVGKLFTEHSHDDIANTMNVNTLALMHITREFFPGMLARKQGHVCNIASAAALLANPKMAVYVASKWAVYGWSESLRIEMEQGKTGVHVTTVCPYYISTGMFSGVKSRIPLLKPDVAAKRIIKAISSNKVVIKLPWIVNLLPFAKAIMPLRMFDFVIGKGFGIYNTMSSFVGRK